MFVCFLVTGAMCAVASCVWPRLAGSLRIGYVASLATKLSDTFASEIGKVRCGGTAQTWACMRSVGMMDDGILQVYY